MIKLKLKIAFYILLFMLTTILLVIFGAPYLIGVSLVSLIRWIDRKIDTNVREHDRLGSKITEVYRWHNRKI